MTGGKKIRLSIPLTDKQRKFLNRIHDDWYFIHLRFEIYQILDRGYYEKAQAKLLNSNIKSWKKRVCKK